MELKLEKLEAVRTTLQSQSSCNLKICFVRKLLMTWTNCGEDQSELTKDYSGETFRENMSLTSGQ